MTALIPILVIGFLLGVGWEKWSSGWCDEVDEAYRFGFDQGFDDARARGVSDDRPFT